MSGLFHCSHTEQNCNRSSSEGINPVCLMVLTVQISLSPGSDCSDLFASWYWLLRSVCLLVLTVESSLSHGTDCSDQFVSWYWLFSSVCHSCLLHALTRWLFWGNGLYLRTSVLTAGVASCRPFWRQVPTGRRAEKWRQLNSWCLKSKPLCHIWPGTEVCHL